VYGKKSILDKNRAILALLGRFFELSQERKTIQTMSKGVGNG
jgi:hypothetical protein